MMQQEIVNKGESLIPTYYTVGRWVGSLVEVTTLHWPRPRFTYGWLQQSQR